MSIHNGLMSTADGLMSTDKWLLSADVRLMAVDSWSMWPDKLLLQTDGALPQVSFRQWFRRFAFGEVVITGSPPDEHSCTFAGCG